MVENLSTAALLCAVILMMMFIGRVPMRQIGKLLGAVVILGAFMLSMIMMFGHAEEKTEPNKQNLTEQVQTESKKEKEKGAIGKVFHRFDTWKGRIDKFLDATDREFLQDAEHITAEYAKEYAESEFEKYRVIQDRLFRSDFDKFDGEDPQLPLDIE